jgi:predicted ATPase
MSAERQTYQVFEHGAQWVRADFHLHTRKDSEFKYAGEENSFVRDYVAALKEQNIRVGVVTNHNKFDLSEFKALRKAALKEEILLLPGVELSVNDGANGVHTLVVFSDAWIENGDDHINPFLTVTFKGKTPAQYENENGRSSQGLLETIQTLKGYHKDFFLVFAHVEDRSGLWNELNGGRLMELAASPLFQEYALAFQKVRTHDKPGEKSRVQLKQWMGKAYCAEVEGSDPKSIDQIGKGRPFFLKVGDLSYEAVKFALSDGSHRLGGSIPATDHSFIERISFTGGIFNDQVVRFSPELNTLIGIRGSGKSAVLECLRYALGIEPTDRSGDPEYKRGLIQYVLGSGGKVVVHARDIHGQAFEIHRILNQQPDVFIDGVHQASLSIRETVLRKPLYFGQKDLSNSGSGFERDLVERLIGDRLLDVRRRIEEQKAHVADAVRRLQRLSSKAEQLSEWEKKKEDAQFNLDLFKKLGVEAKLRKQTAYLADAAKLDEAVRLATRLRDDIAEVLRQDQDDIAAWVKYASQENSSFFMRVTPVFDKLLGLVKQLVAAAGETARVIEELKGLSDEFAALQQGMKEEFAGVQRQILEELKAQGKATVQPNDYLKFDQELKQATQMLDALKKDSSSMSSAEAGLRSTFNALRDLWHEEFKLAQAELDKVNMRGGALRLEVGFKEDKESMEAFLRDMLRGSNVRSAAQKSLVEKYSDFGELWMDIETATAMAGSNHDAFTSYFTRNLADLLTYRPPDRFTIRYHGKELKQHSLGQRASALILFILAKRDNDVIIIDQPEDDLDNQTIYEDVIKLMRALKPSVQFILATHNANFPVLGDAEQVHICRSVADRFSVESGGIDRVGIQQGIVSIMEGGEEAFSRRKEIYGIWRSVN